MTTRKTATTPQWAEDYLQYWRQVLLLHEWQFIISLTAEPLGDEANLAGVTLQPNYNTARIEIRDDIPQDIDAAGAIEKYQWKRTLLHEVLHIRMGRVTEFVRSELMNDTQPSVCGFVSRQFTGLIESYTEVMTGILYEMDEAARERIATEMPQPSTPAALLVQDDEWQYQQAVGVVEE